MLHTIPRDVHVQYIRNISYLQRAEVDYFLSLTFPNITNVSQDGSAYK
jgi:hypothetical protein